MHNIQKFAPVAGRIFVALPFLMGGIGKFMAPEAMGGYMQAMGVSSSLLFPSAVFEVLAAVALIIGFQTRFFAGLLAAFTVLATVLFHFNFADATQTLFFYKNVAITGALLYIFAFGSGTASVDKARAAA